MRRHRQVKTFQGDPKMSRYPWTAKILDQFVRSSLTHPLALWIAFLSIPLWFGPVAALIFLAFVGDVLLH